jgi:glucose/arabinose dehydrogenase
MTRLAALSALVLSLLLASAPMARAGDAEPGFVDTLVVGSLNIPTGADFLPDGRLIVIQKDGAVKLFDGVSTTLLVTIPVCADSEMGLLGIAIDPGFAGNGFLYLYRTHSAGDCTMSSGRSNEVIRVTMGPGDTINISSLVVLLTGIRTDLGNHDGGGLRIGPDGKLYVAVGDTGLGDNQGGPGSSTNPYSQDLNEIEGKILRLNLDGTIPADNPYFGQAGKRGEIFASGFRNPFRFGFDPSAADSGSATSAISPSRSSMW